MSRAILPHHEHYLESLQTMQDMIQMMGLETYFLCVGAEGILAHICVRIHLCMPRWRLEIDSKSFPLHLLPLETLSLNLRLTVSLDWLTVSLLDMFVFIRSMVGLQENASMHGFYWGI